jgi:phosphosulfolactate synthase
VLVSRGRTITEYAFTERYFEGFIKEAAKIGFDIIEIGENSIDFSTVEKEKILSTIR